jgi:protein-S-isoprenylcysteine O-methyltransferase Ste14
MYITLIISGFDAVRYQWTTMPIEFTIAAVVMSLLAFFFALWAMAVNPYFESTVRIQHDRHHQVCNSGPYKIVRHPGYVGLILTRLAAPLILGSWWGLIPSGVIVLLIIFRTALEDRILQKELSGYKTYTTITRYRLIPFVW